MPKYTYRCADCDLVFQKYHSVSERLRDCEACGVVDSLTLVPSSFRLDKKVADSSVPVGSLVKKSIEEFKEALKKEKDQTKNRLWDKNE